MEFNQHVIDRRNQIKDNIYKSYHALPAENQIEKSDESDLEKGGEGSRGGQVIGHTQSGKPIYMATTGQHYGKAHPKNSHFTAQDHEDAAKVHDERKKKASEVDKKNADAWHSVSDKEKLATDEHGNLKHNLTSYAAVEHGLAASHRALTEKKRKLEESAQDGETVFSVDKMSDDDKAKLDILKGHLETLSGLDATVTESPIEEYAGTVVEAKDNIRKAITELKDTYIQKSKEGQE